MQKIKNKLNEKLYSQNNIKKLKLITSLLFKNKLYLGVQGTVSGLIEKVCKCKMKFKFCINSTTSVVGI